MKEEVRGRKNMIEPRSMTVAELIDELKLLPPGAPVRCVPVVASDDGTFVEPFPIGGNGVLDMRLKRGDSFRVVDLAYGPPASVPPWAEVGSPAVLGFTMATSASFADVAGE